MVPMMPMTPIMQIMHNDANDVDGAGVCVCVRHEFLPNVGSIFSLIVVLPNGHPMQRSFCFCCYHGPNEEARSGDNGVECFPYCRHDVRGSADRPCLPPLRRVWHWGL